MKINFVTIFPEFYNAFFDHSIIKRAIEKKALAVEVINFREFSLDKHQKVDDIIYGGGRGMLLMVEPIDRALQGVTGRKILLTPQGPRFDQEKAKALAKEPALTFIAGHYEGFDERISELVDEELSIGDFVLTGGELASMVVADAVVRLIPGVINSDSHANETFEHDLLDYPQYTRPRNYKGMAVPEVLLSGDHAAISRWRKAQQETRTKQRRPDLWARRKQHEK